MKQTRVTTQDVISAQKNSKARKRLVEKLEYLVWQQTASLMAASPRDVKMEGFQEAIVGLLTALDKFDENRVDIAPESYLIQSAKNAVRNFMLRISGRGFIISHQEITFKHRTDEKGRVVFLTKDGRWLMYKEVETWKDIVANDDGATPSRETSSLSEHVKSCDRNVTYEDVIPAKVEFSEDAIIRQIAQENLINRFMKHIDNLPEPKRSIVKEYFGIGVGMCIRTCRGLAERYGISRTSVSNAVRDAVDSFKQTVSKAEQESALG